MLPCKKNIILSFIPNKGSFYEASFRLLPLHSKIGYRAKWKRTRRRWENSSKILSHDTTTTTNIVMSYHHNIVHLFFYILQGRTWCVCVEEVVVLFPETQYSSNNKKEIKKRTKIKSSLYFYYFNVGGKKQLDSLSDQIGFRTDLKQVRSSMITAGLVHWLQFVYTYKGSIYKFHLKNVMKCLQWKKLPWMLLLLHWLYTYNFAICNA